MFARYQNTPAGSVCRWMVFKRPRPLQKRYHSTLPSCTTTDQTAPHLEVIEAIATLGVIADEAHLKRRLRVLHHGRCHYNRGHRFLGLVVKLHPPNNTASS